MIEVRKATLDDAGEYHRMLCEIDESRENRTFLEEELQKDATMQIADMEWYLSGSNRTILFAESNGKLIGYATVLGGTYEVDKRTGSIVVEVAPSHRRQGVGLALMNAIEKFSHECDIHRLELTVLADNEAALALYKRCGFCEEGVRREARWIGGQFRDEIWMSRLLR